MRRLAVRAGHDRAVRADGDAGEAADALVLIDEHDAMLVLGERARDTALDADRVLAVAAVDSEVDAVPLLHLDAGEDLRALEGVDDIGIARIGKGALVLAQVAAEAPFFIDVNNFHMVSCCAGRRRPAIEDICSGNCCCAAPQT